jgi:thioredoxin 1
MKTMDDEELKNIREKKIRELKEKLQQTGAAGSVIEVSEMRMADILASHPALVIDFWAEWCGPCKRVAPAIEELAQEFTGRVTFGKCNTDQNQQIAMQLNISAIPNIVFFSHGKMVDRIIGAYPKEAIREKVIRNFHTD